MLIKSNIRNYEVIIEPNLDFIKNLIHTENSLFVIDKNVYELYKSYFLTIPNECLLIIEASEQNKVIEVALSICEKLTELPAKRNATLISIGGGIIQDITGFVANITYRGINWIFVPTTLLAACDSCIGSKTSLNYKSYKNLLGTFFPPKEIHICSQFFKTLSERDFQSGMGEVIKFNIMAGLDGLACIEANINQLLSRDIDILNQFIEKSLLFKRKFIEIDEFDHNERIKLNFAHTFGHAIEVVTHYNVPHGTAVAIGMIMANKISLDRKYISEQITKRSEKILFQVINIDPELLNKPLENYMKAIRKDKKQIGNSLTSVLIKNYDKTSELAVIKDTTESEVENAIKYFIKEYKTIKEQQLHEN